MQAEVRKSCRQEQKSKILKPEKQWQKFIKPKASSLKRAIKFTNHSRLIKEKRKTNKQTKLPVKNENGNYKYRPHEH